MRRHAEATGVKVHVNDEQGLQQAGHHHGEAEGEENICQEQRVWRVRAQILVKDAFDEIWSFSEAAPTQDGNVISGFGQKVVHYQQEHSVAQD